MICQACEKNETVASVICRNCVSHYAAIREGRFEQREFLVGEHPLALINWRRSAAEGAKQAARRGADAKRGGLFGRKAAPEPEPIVDEVPPPDWKTRVFPGPDAPPALSALETSVPAAPAEPIADVPAPDTTPIIPSAVANGVELMPEEPVVEEETAPVEQDLVAASAEEAPVAGPEVSAAQAEEAPQAAAPSLAALALESTPVIDPKPEAPAVADLSGFFASLEPAAEPEETAAPVEPPAAPEAPAAPVAELSSFFASLSAPAPAEAVVPAAPEPVAETATDATLANFFAGLGAAAPAAAPEATPEPVEAAAPAPVSELADFFGSLTQTAPAAPVEAPAEPESVPVPAADLAEVAAPVEPVAPVETVLETPAVAYDVSAAQAEADLSSFFDSLAAPVPQPSAAPSTAGYEFSMPAATPAEPAEAAPASAFTIELELPAPAPNSPTSRGAGDLRPPVVNAPFSIDLTPAPAPAPQAPRVSSESQALKKKLSSTGELSFEDDEDTDEAGSLLNGIQFETERAKSTGYGFGGGSDDDDEGRTIEL